MSAHVQLCLGVHVAGVFRCSCWCVRKDLGCRVQRLMAVSLMDVSVRDTACAWMLGVSSLISVCIYSSCMCMSMNRNVS